MAKSTNNHYLYCLARLCIRRKPLRIGGHNLFDQRLLRWAVHYDAASNNVAFAEDANKFAVFVLAIFAPAPKDCFPSHCRRLHVAQHQSLWALPPLDRSQHFAHQVPPPPVRTALTGHSTWCCCATAAVRITDIRFISKTESLRHPNQANIRTLPSLDQCPWPRRVGDRISICRPKLSSEQEFLPVSALLYR